MYLVGMKIMAMKGASRVLCRATGDVILVMAMILFDCISDNTGKAVSVYTILVDVEEVTTVTFDAGRAYYLCAIETFLCRSPSVLDMSEPIQTSFCAEPCQLDRVEYHKGKARHLCFANLNCLISWTCRIRRVLVTSLHGSKPIPSKRAR